jgi:ArsR family transcriptional regulator, cadmium/lead-responsive transcriptional repressor
VTEAPHEDPAPVFTALSDPTRREVIRRLSASGPSTLGELAAELPVTRQAISKHLVVLEEAGLVATVDEGRRRRYRLTPQPLADAMDWMVDVGAGWDERLDALRTHVERSS